MTRKVGLELCWAKAKKTSYVTGVWWYRSVEETTNVVRINYIKNSRIQILDVPWSAARTLVDSLEYKIKTNLRFKWYRIKTSKEEYYICSLLLEYIEYNIFQKKMKNLHFLIVIARILDWTLTRTNDAVVVLHLTQHFYFGSIV